MCYKAVIIPGICLMGFLLQVNPAAAQLKNDYPIQPVDFTQVQVTDDFWAPKIKVNADVTIPYTLQKCQSTGRIDNFLRASGSLKDDKHTTYPFDESDVYKVIEGASYSLQAKPNPANPNPCILCAPPVRRKEPCHDRLAGYFFVWHLPLHLPGRVFYRQLGTLRP